MTFTIRNLLRPPCPECRGRRTVYMVDRGIKVFLRMLAGDNRFACRRCRITWRRRTPFDCAELVQRRNDKDDDTSGSLT